MSGAKLVAIALAMCGPLVAAAWSQAKHEKECEVRVLHTLTDDLANTWETGKTLPVTILRKDTKGVSYCAHGGSCVPRMVGRVQATRLLACKPGASLGNGDYKLVPDPKGIDGAAG